ncbi:MAG: gamma-glutamyl-gamma-aminobutyrate hydrolase family protein [Hydrogenophilales bacterium]
MSEMKKIGITLRIEHIEKYDEKRDALSHDWVKFLSISNVFPILIPNNLKDVKHFIKIMNLDGIILSGGDNKGDDFERDSTEKEIIELAITDEIPLLGVCRGMQVLNNFFGGTHSVSTDSNHIGKNHEIELTNIITEKLFNSKRILVNSFHNNLIKKPNLGTDLQVFAVSENDNTVEGFYHKNLPIIGVMWHPEREENYQNELKIMKCFYEKLFWNE